MSAKSFFMSHERPGGSGNEWDLVDSDNRTFLQKIAAKTNGIVTVGNIITAGGLVGIELGARQYERDEKTQGAIKITVSSTADGFDGLGAALSETRGNTGAWVDATADKYAALRLLWTSVHAAGMPKALAAGIGATQGTIVAENMLIKHRGGEPNPNWPGKVAAFFLKAAGISYLAAGVLEEHEQISPRICQGARIVGHVAAGASIAFAGAAIVQYHQQANSLQGMQQEAE